MRKRLGVVLVIIIIILLTLSGITIVQLKENGLFARIKLAEESTIYDNIEGYYEGKQIEENKNQLLLVVRDEENGLDKIEYDNGDILKCNGKNQVGIDYTIEDEMKYMYKVISNNGYEKEIPINGERLDIFGELQKNEKTVDDFPEYGMTISRTGSHQYDRNELYCLGMGSGTGVNRNTFVLTIDYETLISKLDNRQFKGIYGRFQNSASTKAQRPNSWSNSQIIITYEDGTKFEVPKYEVKAVGWTTGATVTEEHFTTAFFKENKKISTIEIVIDMYDATGGGAQGYLLNLELII